MRFLSRPEELVLLAVWKLKEAAYCVPIRAYLTKVSGQNWSFGAIYDPLNRLEKKGLVDSFFSQPTAERGGRRRRMYILTAAGREELCQVKALQEAVWSDISGLAAEEQEA